MFRITIAAAVVTMLTAGNAIAQVPYGGHVVGRVTDASGAVLPGVTVTVTDGNVRHQAFSDADGRFDVSEVAGGSFEVTAELAGFERASRRIAVTDSNNVVEVSFTLKVGEPCVVDYVDVGFADAVADSDAVFYVRVEKAEPTASKQFTFCPYAAVTYTASVIEAVKLPSANRPSKVRSVQDSGGVTSPVIGEEYLVVLHWDSAHSRYTAGRGMYVFGLRGGGVDWHRDDVPAIRDGDPMYHLIDAVREILALRDRR